MQTAKVQASVILAKFEQAQTELVGKAVVLTDGKAGTVENIWLDELHGLRISIKGHEGTRLGHSRREVKGGLRTVFHQQGGRHGHGIVHRAHHYRGAPRTDMGQKSGSRRCVVPDQTSSRDGSYGNGEGSTNRKSMK